MADEERRLSVVEHESFEAIELADEELIVQEIAGRVTDKFVYELKGVKDDKGQPVIGLSYPGTNWAVREYAKQGECIRVVGRPEVIQDPINPEYIVAVVTVQRFVVDPETKKETALDSTFGVKRQWSMMKKRKYDENGNVCGEEIVPDSFYFEKCVSKAIRNGKQSLIPTDVVKKLIAKALELRGTKPAGRPPGPAKPQGKPAPQPPQGTQAKPAPAQAQPAAPPQQTQGTQSAPAPTSEPPAQTSKALSEATASPKPPPTAPAKPSRDGMIQKFEVVLKQAFKTTDAILARQHLKVLSGTDRITDLSDEDISKYGRILQGVTKGQYTISDDKTHILDAQGNVAWGTKPQPPQPAPPPPPATPAGNEENYF